MRQFYDSTVFYQNISEYGIVRTYCSSSERPLSAPSLPRPSNISESKQEAALYQACTQHLLETKEESSSAASELHNESKHQQKISWNTRSY